MSRPLRLFGRALPPAPETSSKPDWQQANPRWIEGALQRALARPTDGWYAVDASSALRDRPKTYRIDGADWVLWRAGSALRAGPDACPHMGASLGEGRVRGGEVVCPWHGLGLGADRHGEWCPVTAHDDGSLLWIRPGDGAPRPTLPPRPGQALVAVVRREAACDPEDVIANRLDPWHGAHFHPHSFARLRVIDQQDDEITVRVVYRLFAHFGIEVDARFHTPDPRTIVMTIERGEGEGSTVETHATPLGPGRCAVIEATFATSDHARFHYGVRYLGWAIRPLMRRAADRLWVEDAAYAERRHRLRTAAQA